uniref:Uncharacterized protein n=1 Tax=Physcomitrium patens TaxID=3218 RepID=A0A2K1KGS8_PHYPA|nr:hypothetical protein PHYPA_009353 [Physcomitrium patens]
MRNFSLTKYYFKFYLLYFYQTTRFSLLSNLYQHYSQVFRMILFVLTLMLLFCHSSKVSVSGVFTRFSLVEVEQYSVASNCFHFYYTPKLV